MAVHFFAKEASAAAAMVACVLFGLLGVATPATAEVRTAVEYGAYTFWDDCWYVTDHGEITGQFDCDYHSYFITSSPDEIAALDGGVFSGWQRTGETFNVWSGPESGALPTCRFVYARYGIEHFYTPYVVECAAVQANADWHWQYEGIAFYLQVPDENGNCPVGTTILYRLYNNGMSGASLHRLTTSPPNWMLHDGWIFEGDGRTGAFACVPSSTESSTP